MKPFNIMTHGLVIFLTSLAFGRLSVNIETVSTSIFKDAPLRADAQLSSIQIDSLPYVMVHSLGDALRFDGLTIEAIYDDEIIQALTSGFTLEGGDELTLGKQTITVNYQNKLAFFDIDVTNLGAVVLPPQVKQLFISEIVVTPTELNAIEIYNGSGNQINYSDYELRLYQGKTLTTLALPDIIKANDTLVIVNDDQAIDSSNQNTIIDDPTLDLSAYDRFELYDKVNSKLLDLIDLTIDATLQITQSGPFEIDDFHLQRDSKTVRPSTTFSALDWMIGNSINSLGSHIVATPTISVETQAVAYGEYVMYGIGMNAASDPFGAFNRLRDEYNYMHAETKQYFLNNKNHEISGINESGRLVTNTFNDAIGRYNYLASRTGNAGLTSSAASLNLDWGEIGKVALFGAIIISAGGAYFVLKRKFSS